MSREIKVHYHPGSVKSACGIFVYWPQDKTWDKSEVTCNSCKRTKKFKRG